MRTQRNLFYLSLFLTITFLSLSIHFYEREDLYYNLCAGIFTGFFTSLLVTLFSYFGEKHKTLVSTNKMIDDIGKLLEKAHFLNPNIDFADEENEEKIRSIMDAYFNLSQYGFKDLYEIEENTGFIFPKSYQKDLFRQILDKTGMLHEKLIDMFRNFQEYEIKSTKYDTECIYQTIVNFQQNIYYYEEMSVKDFNSKRIDLCEARWIENGKCFRTINYVSLGYLYDYNKIIKILHPIKCCLNKFKKINKAISDINEQEERLTGKSSKTNY